MTRNIALLLLAASLLSGCGTAPFAPQLNSASKTSASALETQAQVQIHDAFKRVDATSMRVVVMYWVRKEGVDREFRQLIFDGVPTQDRTVYATGYRPMHFVLNGANVLRNTTSLQKISRELGALNHHTTTKEQQQIVALAFELVQDQLK